MDDEPDDKPRWLIDEKIINIKPEIREILMRMAFEENERRKSIEMEGKKWYTCADCEYFDGLRNDKKGIKTFLKHQIWGYCLNTDFLKKPKKKHRHHLIYIDFVGTCYKPKSKNKNNFLNLMMKQEAENLTELLQNPSLSEEERKYFRELKERYQE